MNENFSEILRNHLNLCQEVFSLIVREREALQHGEENRCFEFYQARKELAPRLDESLAVLKNLRREWQQLDAEQRARYSEVLELVQQNQALIMKIIVADRENEQALLRRGLVPPRHLPSVNRQRPHFVADLYRRRPGA